MWTSRWSCKVTVHYSQNRKSKVMLQNKCHLTWQNLTKNKLEKFGGVHGVYWLTNQPCKPVTLHFLKEPHSPHRLPKGMICRMLKGIKHWIWYPMGIAPTNSYPHLIWRKRNISQHLFRHSFCNSWIFVEITTQNIKIPTWPCSILLSRKALECIWGHSFRKQRFNGLEMATGSQRVWEILA